MAGRQRNPTVAGFGERIEWIVKTLAPDVRYARFIRAASDIHDALERAVSAGTYPNKSGRSARSWRLALQKDEVPWVYIEWICNLFPDLRRGHLLAESLEGFLAAGKDILFAHDRWNNAIKLLAEDRLSVARIAKTFYSEVDQSQRHGYGVRNFPLIVLDGWIRDHPLELDEQTELAWIEDPAKGTSFRAPKLEGLLGDYGSYKGGLTYRLRDPKIEPQHNGEIFCVSAPRFHEGSFVGFKYFLSHYFDYINTSEILGAELAGWMLENGSEPLPGCFDLRRSPEAAFDFSWRAAYPGVNCLTAFKGYGAGRLANGNLFLLHKRDETQIQAQNTVHVLPAGGHQGFARGATREDTAIWRTVVREFFEEIFDLERFSRQQESWEDFLAVPECKSLINLFFTGPRRCARVYLHGFGLDPVTLKPEILVTIVVDWKKAKSQMAPLALKFNWEVTSGNRNATPRIQWAKLTHDELIRQAEGHLQSIDNHFLDTLPAGGACMLLAAKHFNLLFGEC